MVLRQWCLAFGFGERMEMTFSKKKNEPPSWSPVVFSCITLPSFFVLNSICCFSSLLGSEEEESILRRSFFSSGCLNEKG